MPLFALFVWKDTKNCQIMAYFLSIRKPLMGTHALPLIYIEVGISLSVALVLTFPVRHGLEGVLAGRGEADPVLGRYPESEMNHVQRLQDRVR